MQEEGWALPSVSPGSSVGGRRPQPHGRPVKDDPELSRAVPSGVRGWTGYESHSHTAPSFNGFTRAHPPVSTDSGPPASKKAHGYWKDMLLAGRTHKEERGSSGCLPIGLIGCVNQGCELKVPLLRVQTTTTTWLASGCGHFPHACQTCLKGKSKEGRHLPTQDIRHHPLSVLGSSYGKTDTRSVIT